MSSGKLNWPLMKNNISRGDLDTVIEFLSQDDPILTQSSLVEAFEKDWSDWLGTKYSVFVNSGSSANLITISALKEVYGLGEIIVPTLTWVSDIASVIQCGFEPIFVDINPKTLGMIDRQVIEKIGQNTKAVFLTHVLGYNALTPLIMDELQLQFELANETLDHIMLNGVPIPNYIEDGLLHILDQTEFLLLWKS